MLHALCGQYFYIPFFTENVELHIGERNKLDKYSGGYTAWQDEKLNSNGKFIIDFMNAEKVIRNLVHSEEKTIDGITFKLARRFDGKHIFKEIHFMNKGQNFHFTERVQALNLQDFQALLSANFRILETFGSFDLAPFSVANSDRLIIIAELKS
jgi:hypothetical protein